MVATTLVEISNRLGGYASRNWVIGAYLMSYTGQHLPPFPRAFGNFRVSLTIFFHTPPGLIATFASFSKVMGCRFMMIFAVAIFTAFSIGCGLAQDMVTL